VTKLATKTLKTQLKTYTHEKLLDLIIDIARMLKTGKRTTKKTKAKKIRYGKEGKKDAKKILKNFSKMAKANKNWSAATKRKAIAKRKKNLGL
jgi:hypothetical protein